MPSVRELCSVFRAGGVATGEGVAVGVPAVAVGLGVTAVGVVTVGVGVALADGVAGAVGTATAVTVFTSDAVQVTREPPPLAAPLHWLIETASWSLCVDGVTVQVTRSAAPPPLVEPLHCVIVAPVVVAG
jgi:hypothetical protein